MDQTISKYSLKFNLHHTGRKPNLSPKTKPKTHTGQILLDSTKITKTTNSLVLVQATKSTITAQKYLNTKTYS